MGIKDRKIKAKEDLRKAILSAAREIFLQNGFDNMSIRMIAKKIEYSPTTIYLYFKDKDEIFYALHNEGFQLLNKELQVHSLVEDPMEKLKAIGRIYISFAIKNPDFYDLMFVQKSPLNCVEMETWSEGQAAFNFLKDTVQSCMEKKQLKSEDAETGAFVIWSAMHGMCVLKNSERNNVISEEKRDNIVHMGYEAFVKMIEIL